MTRDRRLGRRNPLGTVLGGSPPITAWTPAQLGGAFFWVRGDLGVTTSGGVVDQWNDQIGGRNLVQTGTPRPAYSSSIAGLNNNAGVTGDGVNDKLPFAGSLSDWRFLHDGTGCTIYLVVRTPAAASEGSIFESARVSVGNTGFTFYHQAAGNPIIRVTNSSGTPLWTHSGTAVANSTTYSYIITHSTAAGYSITRNGSVIASGSYTGSAATGNANSLPGLFDSTTSITIWSNWTAGELALATSVASAGDMTRLQAYSVARYGV